VAVWEERASLPFPLRQKYISRFLPFSYTTITYIVFVYQWKNLDIVSFYLRGCQDNPRAFLAILSHRRLDLLFSLAAEIY
jgi:hypothetical protein